MNLISDHNKLPYMLYADRTGQIYEHPYFRMTGFSGSETIIPLEEDLVPLSEFSKLFFLPDCPPIGLDPCTGTWEIVSEIDIDGASTSCYAVAAFLEPGFVRSLLPAVDYQNKTYRLPMWAYTAVGSKDDRYWAAAFRIEDNSRWNPQNYDDRELIPAIDDYLNEQSPGPLTNHLINCATKNHCFAAKNLFLKRWEAPMPVSRSCNAACLGCISLQCDEECTASHQRLLFRPSQAEIVDLAVRHLQEASDGIISFGQGCEGEPLTEYKLIASSIKEIRKATIRGTININTNGSWPDRVEEIAASGLDSIRISLNSARPDLYHAYYRPVNYHFEDVVFSIKKAREIGLFTMLNYLVFPGITDQPEELNALKELIENTGVNFIHFKNLNIDPQYYLENMPGHSTEAIGMIKCYEMLKKDFPKLQLGYFNQAIRK